MARKKTPPHLKRVRKNYTLSPEVAAFLDTEQPNASGFIERLVKNSKEFKEWNKDGNERGAIRVSAETE